MTNDEIWSAGKPGAGPVSPRKGGLGQEGNLSHIPGSHTGPCHHPRHRSPLVLLIEITLPSHYVSIFEFWKNSFLLNYAKKGLKISKRNTSLRPREENPGAEERRVSRVQTI